MALILAGSIPVTHPAFLAQLVEHLSCKQEVTGSSPVGGSSLERIILVDFVLVFISGSVTSPRKSDPLRWVQARYLHVSTFGLVASGDAPERLSIHDWLPFQSWCYSTCYFVAGRGWFDSAPGF